VLTELTQIPHKNDPPSITKYHEQAFVLIRVGSWIVYFINHRNRSQRY